MKMKFLFQILAAVVTLFCLSSCDGGGDGGDAMTIPDRNLVNPTIQPRYPANLDPADDASFPFSLVVTPNDVLDLEPQPFTVDTIPFPTSDGEDEGVILPFGATSMVTDSQTYLYVEQGTNAELVLSGTRGTSNPSSYINGLVNLLGFGVDTNTKNAFFEGVNEILGTQFDTFWTNNPDRPNGLLNVGQDDVNTPTIEDTPTVEEMRLLIRQVADDVGIPSGGPELAAALRDIVGYIGVDNPAAVGEAGYRIKPPTNEFRYKLEEVHIPVRNFMVLKSRKILLTANSKNSDLIDRREISGDYAINDKYDLVFFTGTVDGQLALTAATGAGKPPSETYEDAITTDIDATANGVFTFILSTLGSSDPNQ
jgi:hypothetical protein